MIYVNGYKTDIKFHIIEQLVRLALSECLKHLYQLNISS